MLCAFDMILDYLITCLLGNTCYIIGELHRFYMHVEILDSYIILGFPEPFRLLLVMLVYLLLGGELH